MAFEENGTGTTMLVQPSGFGGYNNGGMFGDSWAWIIILLLCGWGGMGFGGNGFGGGYDFPWILNGQNGINNNTNAGFRDAAIQSSIGDLSTAVTSGFGDIQTALCGGFAGVNATVNNATNAITNRLYDNEIASLNRSFAEQTANTQGFSGLSSQLAQCCCDNRLATCQTQNLLTSEAAATRSAIQAGVQTVIDKMCQDKIDSKNEKIVELQNKLNIADFAASQVAQNGYLQNALTAQTQYLIDKLTPTTTA